MGGHSIVSAGERVWGQNHKFELPALSFGLDPGHKWGGGVQWTHQAPHHSNLRDGELGGSCYGWRVWCCSPWDLHLLLPLHLLPTHSLPSTSTPILLLGTHKWAGYSQIGLRFSADQVDKDNASSCRIWWSLKLRSILI